MCYVKLMRRPLFVRRAAFHLEATAGRTSPQHLEKQKARLIHLDRTSPAKTM
mgnify:CR=1 FL=1